MFSLYIEFWTHLVLALLGFSKPFQIESEICNIAVDGILAQEHTYVHKLIALLSKALTSSEKNYSVHDDERCAIVTFCKTWRPYIDVQWTIVLIKHKPLIHLHT